MQENRHNRNFSCPFDEFYCSQPGLVEAIDLAFTFIEVAGGAVAEYILEGRSLLQLTHGRPGDWREAAVSECDYAFRSARRELERTPGNARAWMLHTERVEIYRI